MDAVTTDLKLAAQQARARADAAEEFVRYLRGLIVQAMADAETAKRIAREADRAAT